MGEKYRQTIEEKIREASRPETWLSQDRRISLGYGLTLGAYSSISFCALIPGLTTATF